MTNTFSILLYSYLKSLDDQTSEINHYYPMVLQKSSKKVWTAFINSLILTVDKEQLRF